MILKIKNKESAALRAGRRSLPDPRLWSGTGFYLFVSGSN